MVLWYCLEAVEGSKPGAADSSRGVVIASVQDASKTVLLPRSFAAEKGIVGNQYALYAKLTRPIAPRYFLVKMLPLN